MRALVVDDDLEIATLVQKILQSQGYQVTLAPNGREALRYIRRYALDLVVLDVMMPGMDGTTVLAELRRFPDLDDTRIVMLTAKNTPRDVVEALRTGADAFVSKPFAIAELLEAAKAPPPRRLTSSR